MGGGGNIVTGFEYNGGICQIIAAGPITRLTRIANGDTVIWEGDVDQSTRDGDGKTVLATTLGSGKLYWGRSDEVADASLAAALVDFGTGATTLPIPAWRHWAKFVMDDCAFGGQPSPPVLVFDFERRLDLLTLSAHEIEDDAVLPEVIYDLLVNAIHSVGVASASVDTVSFAAACETIIDEGLGVSPQIDDTTTLRDFIGTLLEYIDAILYYEHGVIKIKLVRKEAAETAIAINESHLTDEPRVNSGTMADTWNVTRLVFSDRANNWDENAVEPYDDHANAIVQGESVPKDVELPFVTRRDVAKLLAARKGIAGGVPQTSIELRLLPSLRTLKPGDLIAVTYAHLGYVGKLFRVRRRETGGSQNREVVIEALAEITRVETNDYVPPADPLFNLGAFYDANGVLFGGEASATPRLLWLPPDLKSSDTIYTDPDGFLVAFEQPSTSSTKYQVWWTWNPSEKPFKKLEGGTDFPVRLDLLGWQRFRNNTTWLLRAEFLSQEDADYIRSLIEDGDKVFFVAARRLYKQTGTPIDEHQMDGLWFQGQVNGRAEPVDGLIYDIEVSAGAFDAPEPTLETTAGQANYPTLTLYAGRKKDFVIRRDKDRYFERLQGNGSNYWADGVLLNQDTDLVRYIKVVTGTKKELQDLADVAATTYDRDDTTMCPDGTLSREWGAVVLTLSAQIDLSGFGTAFGGATPYDAYVTDLDSALYAVMFGVETDDQSLTVEHLDEVLGFMVQTGVEFYNTTL